MTPLRLPPWNGGSETSPLDEVKSDFVDSLVKVPFPAGIYTLTAHCRMPAHWDYCGPYCTEDWPEINHTQTYKFRWDGSTTLTHRPYQKPQTQFGSARREQRARLHGEGSIDQHTPGRTQVRPRGAGGPA